MIKRQEEKIIKKLKERTLYYLFLLKSQKRLFKIITEKKLNKK